MDGSSERKVELVRADKGVYDAVNPRGGRLRVSTGDDADFSPVELLLVKPQSYMNLSGTPVQAVLTRTRTPLGDLLVVHDDVDLPLGRRRFKQGGGAGGQKGVKDVIARLGPGFLRLKVGVSRPPPGWATEGWVLSRFRPEERELLDRVVAAAADAVETLYREGLEAAMNRTNGLDLAASVTEG